MPGLRHIPIDVKAFIIALVSTNSRRPYVLTGRLTILVKVRPTILFIASSSELTYEGLSSCVVFPVGTIFRVFVIVDKFGLNGEQLTRLRVTEGTLGAHLDKSLKYDLTHTGQRTTLSQAVHVCTIQSLLFQLAIPEHLLFKSVPVTELSPLRLRHLHKHVTDDQLHLVLFRLVVDYDAVAVAV